MPTAPVKPYVPEGRLGRRLPFDLWVPALVIVALLAVALLSSSLRAGPYVSRVTFDNSSAYSFEVTVASGSHSATTLLGNVAAKNDTSVHSIYDQGSTWTFRFASQDQSVGEVVMSRSDLVRDGWHVTVPDRFAQALASEGVPPTD
jgi:hypothetical protein